jgi:hypothetical protein
MDFRRSGPLDERRRRVLMDEIATPADAENSDAFAGASAKGPVRAYHETVLTHRQPKVTDLLPVRPLAVVACLVLGLGGIAAIQAIHVQIATLKPSPTLASLTALDARHRGSLDDWYASAMLTASAALAALIFGIRSHRVDDYRGRYRVWLTAAAALLWLSLDAATGIHEAVGMALYYLVKRGPWEQIPAEALSSGCTYAWLIVYAIVFGALGLRLALEIWPSRLGSLALVCAGALYVTTALLELNVLHAPATLPAGAANSTAILLAHFSLLTAIGFFARHVLLDAGGRLKVYIDPHRKAKSKKAKPAKARAAAAEPATTSSSTKSTSAAPTAASTAAAKPALAATYHEDDDEEDDDSDDARYEGLSRSERRRMKKLARREQRRAA